MAVIDVYFIAYLFGITSPRLTWEQIENHLNIYFSCRDWKEETLCAQIKIESFFEIYDTECFIKTSRYDKKDFKQQTTSPEQ